MSETQNDYDTDAGPTPGPWTNRYAGNPESDEETMGVKTTGKHYGYVADTSMARPEKENIANARLIAAAGTAAHELPDEYDAVAAIESMPKQIRTLEHITRGLAQLLCSDGEVPESALEDLRKNAQRALSSAEGSGDE